ncbi:MAG: hypothetical protein RR350_03390 [Oscillibacter sp.]
MMKDIWKYILLGLGVVFLYWVWIAFFPSFFNGMTWEVATTVGTGFFLSFEIVILAGIIISKMKNK